ncbi:nuclear transport factor 2 family protein [Kitasatospora sp. NPDC088346]|uniref:nuclear transport factor 2 family protein n=1 Tax=Kitasatospora sp. NPDC088346 TaxID=3364073 RepID=UPI00380D3778
MLKQEENATRPAEEQVRTYYDLVDSGDVAGLVALFTPDAVYFRPGHEQPFAGHAQISEFYTAGRVIDTGSHRLAQVMADRDGVAVHGEFRGVLKDGTRVAFRFADFFALAPDGRFSRRDTYYFMPPM